MINMARESLVWWCLVAMSLAGVETKYKNIAFGKRTQQSSTLNDCKWAGVDPGRLAVCGNRTSALAVDGKTSSDYWLGTCTHTDLKKQTAWWSVDLGKEYLVSNMKIYFSRPDRIHGFFVNVDSSLCYEWSGPREPTSPVSVTCNTPVSGRNVIVKLPTDQAVEKILNLCEVEIYECADYWFGANCSSHCFCGDVLEVCDKVSGDCISECPDGYTGLGCQMNCPSGLYGRDCERSCGKCFGGDTNCDPVDGTCTQGCQVNWTKDQCKECADFHFGSNCDWECECKDIYEVCNKTTGQCVVSGCGDGRTGLDCYTPCKGGKYGFNCSFTCGWCLGEVACGKIEGECIEGCVGGFSEPTCQDCKDGFFGRDCLRCGQCLVNTSCNKDFGHCPKGCQPGWKGNQCHQECQPGYYGLNCVLKCGHCKGQCDPVDGNCDKTGCMEDWTGQTCKEDDFLLHMMNIAGSGRVKVYDVIESRSPAAVSGSPSVTTDGNTSMASCVTISGTQPSWTINFEKQYTIHGLALYVPSEVFQSDVNVLVDGKVCYYWTSGQQLPEDSRFRCYEPVIGNDVKISVPRGDVMKNLSLCEVHVYAARQSKSNLSSPFPVTYVTTAILGFLILGIFAIVLLVVLWKHKVACFKSNENGHNYDGLEPKTSTDNYTPIQASVDHNNPGINAVYQNDVKRHGVYENEDICQDDEHIYVEPAEVETKC